MSISKACILFIKTESFIYALVSVKLQWLANRALKEQPPAAYLSPAVDARHADAGRMTSCGSSQDVTVT